MINQLTYHISEADHGVSVVSYSSVIGLFSFVETYSDCPVHANVASQRDRCKGPCGSLQFKGSTPDLKSPQQATENIMQAQSSRSLDELLRDMWGHMDEMINLQSSTEIEIGFNIGCPKDTLDDLGKFSLMLAKYRPLS